MRGPRLRSTIRSVVAILCAACFLTMSLGSVSRAIAADPWETWPKKTTVPGVAPNPETDANRAAKAAEAAEKEPAKGSSSGRNWWIAAGDRDRLRRRRRRRQRVDEPRPPLSGGSLPIR